MKKCTKCKITKELSEFYKSSNRKDGTQSYCKKCTALRNEEYFKTMDGVFTRIYGQQRSSSTRREHEMPLYTKQEMSEWLKRDWLFNLLYTNWCNCGYIKSMKPSIDRLDDNKGYSFDNIQVMTWAENREKEFRDHKSGKLDYDLKKVSQFSISGGFIRDFMSVNEAGRQTSVAYQNISKCCIGNLKSAGGFRWEFK